MDIKVIVCVVLVLVILGNDVEGHNQRKRRSPSAQFDIGSPFSNPNWAQDHFNAISAQNDAIRQRIEAQIQAGQTYGSPSSMGGGLEMPMGSGGMTTFRFPSGGFQMPMETGGMSMYGFPTGGSQMPSGNDGYPRFVTRIQNFGIPSGMSAPGYSGQNLGPSNFGFGTPMGGSFASGSASIGPEGGYQSGIIGPSAPGIESRFGEDVPISGGPGVYGVFTQSHSSSGTGPDGQVHSHRVVTTGINDNGKVTYKTIHDP